MKTILGLVILAVAATAHASEPCGGVSNRSAPCPPALGPTIERRLHSDHIDASSFLWNDWNQFVENYHPNYIADDDPATAWVEGAKGSGAGEWLHVQVTPLEHTTKVRLRVRNGYQKSRDLFAANARARDVVLRLMPSKVEKQVTLADKEGWQDVVIEQPDGLVRTVELTVKSVYEGRRYEDLCLSDVQVFATSRTPDNPAFEKSKHETLMGWRAARLAAAKAFKAQKTQLPLYPAYRVDARDQELDGDSDLAGMIAAAAKDPAFARDWKQALAVAADTAAHLDAMPRAQVAPASLAKLVAADGLEIPRVGDIAGGEGGSYHPYDEGALRLPMLDYVSTLFASQLRLLDVKDRKTISAFLADDKPCKGETTWVRRSQPKEQTGPAKVEAVAVGRCARVEVRDGSFIAHAIELYVYDADGRLALAVADGHLDAYRWVDDGGRPMLAGGRAVLWSGKRIEAKKREAVAAK
jgi:hypothetical protein